MPDTLYDHDILAWSERQADLLRRLARGERVNDVDWEHVAEEIEDVGQSELSAVRSYLRLMLVHLLKVHGWQDSTAADHWRREISSFQSDALQRFAPSMRRRIDLAVLYDRAVKELSDTRFDNQFPRAWPTGCPVGLDDLLNSGRSELEARFTAAGLPITE